MTAKRTNTTPHQDPEVAIENAIDKTESFLVKNGKILLTILGVVVLGVGAYMWYAHAYMPKQAEKAGAMMFVAEQYFAEENYDLALNGDGNNPGFLDVIARYGKTPQGNIANHYAGLSYLHNGEYENALRYLEKYSQTTGAPNAIINAQNFGLQGDVYVQLQQYDKAIERYKKAVDAADNILTAPLYLKKLGFAQQRAGKGSDAVASFQRITDQYPTSTEARDIQKYAGAAEQL